MKGRRSASASLLVIGLLGLLVVPRAAWGPHYCNNLPQGRICTAEVEFQRFVQTAHMSQRMSQWCWAASISMVFSYLGHPVSQPRIVAEVYGSLLNIPQPGYLLAQQLNRSWLDDWGRPFPLV